MSWPSLLFVSLFAFPLTAVPPPPDMAARQWENAAAADGAQCRAMLSRAGFHFTPARDVAGPDRSGCGIPHGVVVSRGPTGVVYDPPLVVDCSFALALYDVERIVQEEAAKELHTQIARVGDLGSFACRHRRGRFEGTMSEHSFGMAADFATFVPKDGRAPIVVARDYELGRPDEAVEKHAGAVFLRAVYWRLRAESGLSFVLGPEFNAEHRDHFHLDRGYRWWTRTLP